MFAPLARECTSSIEAWWAREAELPEPEQKPASWLSALSDGDKVAWWEGDTVFLRLGAASRSVAHYATRIFFLHQVLSNPTAYGAPAGGFSNVVVVALPELAKKLRYRRSWHHGLLAAVVHPAVPQFRLRDVADAVGAPAADRASMRVYVSAGVENLARGRRVPCFRRAVLPGQLDARFFVPDGDGPGAASAAAYAEPTFDTAVGATPWADVARFRLQLAGSVGAAAPPPLRRTLLYVTRAGQPRSFDAASEAAFGDALAAAAAAAGFAYTRVAMAAASFREQVDVASAAGVMVGVHGAQLAASIFLPPGAVLVEVFPYRFAHRLYRGGCGAGLKYLSLALEAGTEWPALAAHGGDAAACVATDAACRDHYRSDDRPLGWGGGDAAVLRERLAMAFGHVVARTGTA
ncbi:hypothetical protein BU14_0672s0007 [Porphyra umbilicalis]|uniref:Glycosyltransferase 61 catalytic domain-containing protein n=1 Tax=Porphyra umbilicalis TaxID=2786 RepID=A0A1X6NQA1_PORUM|nr:hypothetical protein BU14_0672s0007 [Porphyra umbilicalis]|eukprot:OSX70767.1 hypothetical protein BU14_0672s0007 [Porphyra umbilicalis]